MNQAPAWPASASISARPAFRTSRRLVSGLLAAAAVLLLLPAVAASAAPGDGAPPQAAVPGSGPQKSELMIVIMSIPNMPDSIGVTYNDDPGDDQVKKDLKEVARVLGSSAGPIEITRRAGLPAGETNISGLADWHTGQVALDPLIQAYRRYGHFHVVYMFAGSFPLKAAEQFAQGPIRVEPHVQDRGGNSPGGVQRGLTVDYEIWVDQKNGPPKNIPSVNARPAGLDPVRMGLVAALLGVALLIIVLMVKVVRARGQAEGERPDWESQDAVDR